VAIAMQALGLMPKLAAHLGPWQFQPGSSGNPHRGPDRKPRKRRPDVAWQREWCRYIRALKQQYEAWYAAGRYELLPQRYLDKRGL